MITFDEIMGIEKDIKQRKFRNEWQKATINILYTQSWLHEQLKDVIQAEGMTPQQYNVMRILRGSHPKPLTVLDIRSRMLDKMSDASRIVDRLLVKGWVTKKICTADKRLVDVSITSKGLNLLEKLDKKESEMDNIVKNITEAEAKTLNKILDKLRGN